MNNEKKLKALQERARRLKVDFVDLSSVNLDETIAETIGFSFASQHKIVPVQIKENCLILAMEDPTDLYLVEQMEVKTRRKIIPVLADTDEIKLAINILYREITADEINIPQMEEKDFQQILNMINPDTVRWFKSVLANALKRQASDIHIETHEKDIKVRYRIDGIISETASLPREMESQIYTFIKSLSGMKLEKRSIPQDGFFEISLRGQNMVVRVGTLPTRINERFIIRIMDGRQLVRSLENLDFNPEILELVKKMLSYRQGLIIISGPSGSGMSSTLYSIVSYLSKSNVNIITIEDPIEATLPEVNQMEINPRMDMGYKECLRAALRHAPDVIMVARIRDLEVAQLLIESALTGQLALSGLYARDSISAITRLIEFGIEPYLLSIPLIGVISKRLARTICPDCAEPLEVPPEVKKELIAYNIPEPYKFRAGKGCNHCLKTGFRGRIGFYEVLPISESLRSMILKDSPKDSLQEQVLREGMKPLIQDGLEKVAQGLTTYDEIKRILID